MFINECVKQCKYARYHFTKRKEGSVTGAVFKCYNLVTDRISFGMKENQTDCFEYFNISTCLDHHSIIEHKQT